MSTERLGLDLDGVLYPFYSALETYCRVNKDFIGTTDEFYRYIDKHFEIYDLDWLIQSPDIYLKFLPTKKQMDFLNSLGKRYQLFYITSRPITALRVTQKYLRDYKYPQDNNLIFSKEKDTYARLLGLNYFVEDNAAMAEKLSKACMSFLVDQPYNQWATGNFVRIKSLFDLEGILL